MIILVTYFFLMAFSSLVSSGIFYAVIFLCMMPINKYTYGLHFLIFYDLKNSKATQMSKELVKENRLKTQGLNILLLASITVYIKWCFTFVDTDNLLTLLPLPLASIFYFAYYVVITAMFLNRLEETEDLLCLEE